MKSHPPSINTYDGVSPLADFLLLLLPPWDPKVEVFDNW